MGPEALVSSRYPEPRLSSLKPSLALLYGSSPLAELLALGKFVSMRTSQKMAKRAPRVLRYSSSALKPEVEALPASSGLSAAGSSM
mmetsp:Transcript_35649/g.88695  ORF Transcript_35649/g.88695 Transcript_35649/m.88695 type:complete len:86 (+) Transcript_35649:1719-1976(+)